MDVSDAELADIADDIGADLTTLQSEAVKDCAESVKRENPDMDKSTAFAICQDMDNRGVLQAPSHVALAAQRDPGRIERVEAEGGEVRYKNVMLLAPGVWGDAGSRQHFLYSAENTIPSLADNIVDNTLNLFHEQENDTTEVGELDESSVYIGDDDGALYGDIVLSMDNAASKFADESLQDALESKGRKGIKGPSVEVKSLKRRFNRSAGAPEVLEGELKGVGLVGLGVSPGPGSEDAAFAEQTRERAVALSSDADAAVLTRTTNRMNISELRERLEAEEITLADDADEDDLRALADALDIELQDDDDEDGDPDDEPPEDGDGDNGGDNPDDDGDDGDDDDDQDVDIDLEDLSERMESMQEQVQSNAERIEALADATETLQSEEIDLSELAESVQTLSESAAKAERLEALDERLQAIEDETEEPTSLASIGGTEATGDDDAGVYVDFGSADANTNREY